jgi:hypothetical protein
MDRGSGAAVLKAEDEPAPKLVLQSARSAALLGFGDPPRCQARKSAPSTRPSKL